MTFIYKLANRLHGFCTFLANQHVLCMHILASRFNVVYLPLPEVETSPSYIAAVHKCTDLIKTKITTKFINFIALIHPIQWTIAYPVGADRPAKRQKKTSCVSTGQAGPVLCTRQVACSTSFLSRQRDVIASFSFGACPVYTKI